MGYELDAFLGKTESLLAWKNTLPSAVVADVVADVGLVPLTSELYHDLAVFVDRQGMAPEESGRTGSFLDLGYVDGPGWPMGPIAAWGRAASVGTTIAFITARYFGDDGDESVTLWTDGKASRVQAHQALEALGVVVPKGMDITSREGILNMNTRGWVSKAR